MTSQITKTQLPGPRLIDGSDINAIIAIINQIAASTLQSAATAITTVGAGTLTAAALVGGVINRSGPTSAFTDTTDTAANIAAVLGGSSNTPASAGSFMVDIKNTTAFAQTLAGGTGVTFSGSTITPPNSVSSWLYVSTSATAGVFNHIATVPLTTSALEISTTLSTVGAGTITGAGIAGGVTSRTGSQSGSAFTDTTDTADLIIAAQPNAHVGQSWEYTYVNTTNAPATLTGGTGVTVSGITIVPAKTQARFLVTYTAASTVTIVGILAGHVMTSSGTFTNNGSTPVTVTDANVTAFSAIIPTLKTVGGTVGAIPAVKTITSGTGFTIAGTASDTSVYNYLIIG